jgi:hypothetical protein
VGIFRGREAASRRLTLLALLTVFVVALVGASSAGATPVPGTPTGSAQFVAPFAGLSSTALAPVLSDTGQISLSVDGLGSSNPAGGPILVFKPAGGTVREAFMFAAGTGFSGYTPSDTDVTIDGSAVTWNPAETIANNVGSGNVMADVTSMVSAKLNAAPAGLVSFTVAEGANTDSIDGEVLAVVFNNPSSPTDNTVALLYGSQNSSGDTFPIALGTPIDKSNPNLDINMGLGISFGYQAAGDENQFSNITVDNKPLSGAAGGQDDCDQKYAATPDFASCGNGSLLTVGGIGDTTANPTDPTAPPADSCSPRCDDELYDLLPFVSNGDTKITVNTVNPSNDDNIFLSTMFFKGTTALVGEGVLLTPQSALNAIGANHTLTATVQDASGNPIAGTTVTFTATAGPNAGVLGTAKTNASGVATLTYSSHKVGTDTITASFTDGSSGDHFTSNPVTKTWYVIAAQGTKFNATAGKSFTNPVATFTDQNTKDTASQYTASIKWGDGATSTGTISGSAGKFTVTGKHTYAKAGTDSITTTITQVGNALNTASAVSTATVKATAVKAGHASLNFAGLHGICSAGSFTARVSGSHIASVKFYLDGKRISSRTVHHGSRYSAVVKFGSGKHHLTAKVTFTKASHTKAKTLRKTISHCRIKPPRFTG